MTIGKSKIAFIIVVILITAVFLGVGSDYRRYYTASPLDINLRNRRDTNETVNITLSKNGEEIFNESYRLHRDELIRIEDLTKKEGSYQMNASVHNMSTSRTVHVRPGYGTVYVELENEIYIVQALKV